jgi:glycine betaine catabolism A
MLLTMHPNYVVTHRLYPQGTGQTQVVCEWLFDPKAIAHSNFDANDAIEFWDLTNRQDWQACELTQQGIESQAFTPGLYAHQEGLLAAFNQEYLRVIGC